MQTTIPDKCHREVNKRRNESLGEGAATELPGESAKPLRMEWQEDNPEIQKEGHSTLSTGIYKDMNVCKSYK